MEFIRHLLETVATTAAIFALFGAVAVGVALAQHKFRLWLRKREREKHGI